MDAEYIEKVKIGLGGVLDRIRTASKGRGTELLLATKTVPAEVINYTCENFGVCLIGENKAQELLSKYDALHKDKMHIHFIGHLQTNKVRQIIDKVEMIHSLDRAELAREISRRALAIGKKMDVLIEINIAREAAKGGVYPENAAEFIKSIAPLEGIAIKGLMTMAPAFSTAKEYEMYFLQTKALFDEIAKMQLDNVQMQTLSMGMSDSYEQAAKSGATMVRVGSAVFGRRFYPEKIPAEGEENQNGDI